MHLEGRKSRFWGIGGRKEMVGWRMGLEGSNRGELIALYHLKGDTLNAIPNVRWAEER